MTKTGEGGAATAGRTDYKVEHYGRCRCIKEIMQGASTGIIYYRLIE